MAWNTQPANDFSGLRSGHRLKAVAALTVMLLGAALMVLLLRALANSQEESSLSNACTSVQEIGEKVLTGFTGANPSELEGLRITEDEFKNLIWPQLPRSRRECNFPWDYAWRDLNRKSTYYLNKNLALLRTKKYTFVSIRFAGNTTDYKTYKVYRDSRVLVRDENGGKKELRLFGSIVELDKKYKIMSFVTD